MDELLLIEQIFRRDCEASKEAGVTCHTSCDSWQHNELCPYVYPSWAYAKARDALRAITKLPDVRADEAACVASMTLSELGDAQG